MATPTNRVPVRVARGFLPTLQASIADLFEGELVYAVDESALFVLEGQTLVPVAGTSVLSVNGQTGNVVLKVSDLDDINFDTLADGDMLVYSGGEWVNTPATAGGTVFSVDVEGTEGIESTGGPITNSGVIQLALEDSGVAAGEYSYPTITVDEKGRVTSITSNPIPGAELGLDELQDVEAPNPGIGDALVWDGSNWVNSPDVGGSDVEDLGDLNDVSTDGALDGQALIWDQANAEWRPRDVASGGGGGATTLEELLDVDVNDAETGNPDKWHLTWSDASDTWIAQPAYVEGLYRVQDVGYYVPNIQRGHSLLWDGEKWTSGFPEIVGRDSNLVSENNTNGTLLGGDNPLSPAGWFQLGFYQAINASGGGGEWKRFYAGETFPETIAAEGAKFLGGLRPAMGTILLQEIVFSQQSFAISGLDGVYESTPPSDWTSYDYQLDSTSGVNHEFSLFANDAKRFNMQVTNAGICPSYTDENGTKWTILRKELTSDNNSTWKWAQELWISERGSFVIKQGKPSFDFVWGSNPADSHGIYVSNGGTAVPGYGNGVWVGLPDSGRYEASTTVVVEQAPPPSLDLNDLKDVDVTNATNNQILKYNSLIDSWYAADESGGGVENLSDLDDVSPTAPSTGEALVWNGFVWAPAEVGGGSSDVESISDLDDVDTESSAPAVGQLLAWNGSNWVPADAPVTGATSLDDLTDVDVTEPAPQDAQVLSYSQSDDEWQAANPRATSGAPTATNFPGKPGEMRFDADYFYICVAPDTWKQVLLSDITSEPQPPVIGDIADGGNWTDDIAGTVDTILDGGNWTTGETNDEQDVVMDGGYFTPEPDPVPGPDDTIDGGDFEDGTPGNNFKLDGGNFTTGAAAGPDFVADGGVFTSDVNIPGPDDIIDGGDFDTGAPGTDFKVDGGNFTTGEAGGPDVTLDGGYLTPGGDSTPGPDDSVDGGNWTDGTPGTDFYMDGGNFTTGQAGTGGIADGGDFTNVINLPGPDDTVDGGNWIDGSSQGDDFFIDGGNFTTGEAGKGGTIDGGDFSAVIYGPANGGNFTTGVGGSEREIVDGGQFTLGYVIEDIVTDGGDFTNMLNGEVNETIDGGEFSAS